MSPPPPLSVEVLVHILRLATVPDWRAAVRCGAVCRAWRNAARDPAVWRVACRHYGVDVDGATSAASAAPPAPSSDTAAATLSPSRYLDAFQRYVVYYGPAIIDDYAVVRRICRRLAAALSESSLLALSPPGPWLGNVGAGDPRNRGMQQQQQDRLQNNTAGDEGDPDDGGGDDDDELRDDMEFALYDMGAGQSRARAWTLNVSTASRAEIQLALFFHIFSSGQDGSWIDSTRVTALGLFGTFSCYQQLYSAYLLPLSKIKSITINPLSPESFPVRPYTEARQLDFTVRRVIKFAEATMPESYGVVVEGSPGLIGHVIRFGNRQVIHRMATPRGAIPFFDLGPFDEFLDRFTADIETRNRSLLHNYDVPSAFLNGGPSTSVAMTNGIEIAVSTFYLLNAAKICYRIIMTFHPDRCEWSSVQLSRRRWLFTKKNGLARSIEGEGVIGIYPHLSAANPTFVYSSYSEGGPVDSETAEEWNDEDELTLDNPVVAMEGGLTFVPGSLAKPLGEPFEATVARANFTLPLLSW
ncbi:F-box protein skip16 [Cladochytrium tenue]|nr:F-box protein skip16 [Cladochytrium tenue]